MAAKSINATTKNVNTEESIPRVRILIPMREEDDSQGVAVDHYEHVTINGETTLIRRGESVEVTVPVYMQLRNKYPKL